MKRVAVVALVVLGAAACGKTLREEMPNSPTTGIDIPGSAPAPVVVVPVPIPSSNPGPAPAPPSNPQPQPTAQPTAQPTSRPTATPAPSTGGSATAQVTAGVHSYLRNGRLVQGQASRFQVGDVIYLNCTPRDSAGQPVGNHGPLQGWWVEGSARFNVTDTNSFNPDCHTLGPGTIDIACQVDGIRSPWKRLTVE